MALTNPRTGNANARNNLFNMMYKAATHPTTQGWAVKTTGKMLKQMGKKKRAFQPAQGTNVPTRSAVVNAPVAQNTVRQQGGARVRNIGNNNSITVTHSERFGTADTSILFNPKLFSLQPGIGSGGGHMFPWLAGIARQYETYRFNSCKIKYRPNVSTSTPGHIMIAPDYDPLDPAPASGIEIESFKNAVSGPVWQPLECVLTRQDLQRRSPKFVRAAAAPLASDLKTYDTGNIFVCTEGSTAAVTAGYLYVEYSVELFTPAKPSALAAAYAAQIFNISNQFALQSSEFPGVNHLLWEKVSSMEGRLDIFTPGDYVVYISHDQPIDPQLLFVASPEAFVSFDHMTETVSGFHRWRVSITAYTVSNKNSPPYITMTQNVIGVSGYTFESNVRP